MGTSVEYLGDALERLLARRVPNLHFKDGAINAGDTFTEAETEDGKIMVSNDIPFLPAGTGEIDLLGAAKVMQHTQYVAVELDRYSGDMMKAVQESYNWLCANEIAVGNK